jgi:hypothetical protein
VASIRASLMDLREPDGLTGRGRFVGDIGTSTLLRAISVQRRLDLQHCRSPKFRSTSLQNVSVRPAGFFVGLATASLNAVAGRVDASGQAQTPNFPAKPLGPARKLLNAPGHGSWLIFQLRIIVLA